MSPLESALSADNAANLAALQRATGCSPAATWTDIIAVVTELNANASEFGNRLRERATPPATLAEYEGIGKLAADAQRGKRGAIRKLAAALAPYVEPGHHMHIAEAIATARLFLHRERE